MIDQTIFEMKMAVGALPFWSGFLLGSHNCELFSGQSTCTIMGGASLTNSKPAITGALTDEQTQILNTVANELEPVTAGDTHYLFGGSVAVPLPDLEAGEVIVTCEPNGGSHCGSNSGKWMMDTRVTINTQFLNSGPVDVKANEILKQVQDDHYAFTLRLIDEITSDNGQTVTYPVAERKIQSLAAWQAGTESFDWTLPKIPGLHTIQVILDSSGTVREMSESNNTSRLIFEVGDPNPKITLIRPEAGSVLNPGIITFEATAQDGMNGEITEASAYRWNSSIDGDLGAGPLLTALSLSVGGIGASLTLFKMIFYA